MDNYGQPMVQPPQNHMYYPPENYVSYEEKRKIRHTYNVIGLTLLTLYILTEILCTVGYRIIYSDPDVSVQYDEYGYMIITFRHMLIGGCMPAISAIIVFAGYCFLTRYDPKELFRTENIRIGEIFRFAMIILFLQQVSVFGRIFIDTALDGFGLAITDFDYIIEHTPQTYALDFFSSVILAPIGEELIYRGVVLRCSAKISQRFAIFFSAFIFGIMHGNPYQLLLGFLNGIILAQITIKTGSLIPAIICHAANNALVSVISVIEYFDEDMSYIVSLLIMVIFFIAGIIVFVQSVMTGKLKLPEYTSGHKSRTFPILITSWSTIIVMILYLFDLIGSVSPIEPPMEVTEAVRVFIK